MTDRSSSGLNHQFDQRLRYQRRSSVYSRRTLDNVLPLQPIQQSIVKKPVMRMLQDVVPSNQKATQPLQVQPVVIEQQESHSEPQEAELSWKQRLFSKNSMLTSMAAFVFLLGVIVSGHALLTNKHVSEQVQAISSNTGGNDGGTSGSEMPDEEPVHSNAISGYKVAPELPRKISIPKINVAARVKPLGVSKDNQLLAPAGIYDAGWYNASAKPGVDAGAVLIDGHVHGPTKPGIFYDLKKLVPGDAIQVERGDGRVITYKVEKTQSVRADEVDMGALLTSVKPGKQGLNLITCGGKYDAKAGHYESRDIVFAVQAE